MASLKKTENWFSRSLNAGQKYCRMLQGERSAILLTFIKLPFVIKFFVLSVFEWPFYTGFTVLLSKAGKKILKRFKLWEVIHAEIAVFTINRGSYVGAHVLLNLLNELRKRDKMQGLLNILSLFRN